MKIKNIEKVEIHIVETEEDYAYRYTRYGPESWMVTMGESEEPVYDCEEIEKLFQEAKGDL